ncbi:hypothetical protein AAVH_05778 [Aphelenchoides avenae]|nr:hypothetical protein AAVH_05778 [Aphelenchus avenae]
MGISNKEAESHFSRLIRDVDLMEDANDPTSIYMRLPPPPTSASNDHSGIVALEGFDHRPSLTNRTAGFSPRHRFTVGSASSSAESSQEFAYPRAPFSDGAAARRISGFGTKVRESMNGFGSVVGRQRDWGNDPPTVKKGGTFRASNADMKGNFGVCRMPQVQNQSSVEGEQLEGSASARVFGFDRLSPLPTLADSRIRQESSPTPSALLKEHGTVRAHATDGSEDSSSDDTDLDAFEIVVPESPPSDLEDWRQARASVPVGIVALVVGFLSSIYAKILQCFAVAHRGFIKTIRPLWAANLSIKPSDSDRTDQILQEIRAGAGTPSLRRSDSTRVDADAGVTDCVEVDSTNGHASDSSLVKDGAVADGKAGGHAVLVAAITMNVASRAPRSISTDDLLLVLRAQYGRDVSPLGEAGVDMPFSEYIRRYCSAVFVDEGPGEQAQYLLKKKKSDLCAHLRDLLGWTVD